MEESFSHPLYTHCEEKAADAIAWAFVSADKMIKFPFKFPPLQPNEIRANILYTGLCHSDVGTVREQWGPAEFPIVPGHEIVAEVSQIGSKVKAFKQGDKVAFGTMRDCCEKCKYCLEGREEICQSEEEKFTYGKYWGGYATALQQPASFFFHLPDTFNFALGAPGFCAGTTTYYPMQKFLKPGMKTAVVGIGGGGHIAIKFLHKMGYNVTGLTSSPDKVEMIKQGGADSVVVTSDNKQMNSAADKFDFIINTLPSKERFGEYLHTTAPGGVFVQVGLPTIYDSTLEFTTSEGVCKEICLVGSGVGPRENIKKMINLCVEKDIYPTVEEFAFEDFPKAFDKLENGKPHFRCVVNVKDFAEKNGFKK